MSAVLKPQEQDGRSPSVRSLHASTQRSRSTAPRSRASRATATVQVLPTRSRPGWLQGLIWAQQGSAVLMLTVLAGLLGVYGWSVYVQQTWGRTYQKLETLQRQQQQMTATMEVLRSQAAQAIEDGQGGYHMPHPEQLIFMVPADLRPPREIPPPETTPPAPRPPLGY
jgi:hypothetical protein